MTIYLSTITISARYAWYTLQWVFWELQTQVQRVVVCVDVATPQKKRAAVLLEVPISIHRVFNF